MPGVTSMRQRAKQVAKRWLFRSRYPHYCPLCEMQLRFRPFGVPERSDALCPQCGSLERHRLTWLFLRRYTDLLSGRANTLLHVAPEPFRLDGVGRFGCAGVRFRGRRETTAQNTRRPNIRDRLT